jgi:hypothetical protein
MATGLSIAALVIALVSAGGVVYSVVIGKQALAWQKQQDLARVTPSVHIEFEHAAEPRSQLFWAGDDLEDERPLPLDYTLTISVVNTGETTEHLKRLRVEAADHSEGVDLTQRGTDTELQPRARFPSEVQLRSIPEWESGFIAIASLVGSGDVASAVEYADDHMLAHIEEHNRNARP